MQFQDTSGSGYVTRSHFSIFPTTAKIRKIMNLDLEDQRNIKLKFILRARAAPNKIQFDLALAWPNGTLIHTSNLIHCSSAELIMLDAASFFL